MNEKVTKKYYRGRQVPQQDDQGRWFIVSDNGDKLICKDEQHAKNLLDPLRLTSLLVFLKDNN